MYLFQKIYHYIKWIFDEKHCPKCGGYMHPHGYFYAECDNCKHSVIGMNRAYDGRL